MTQGRLEQVIHQVQQWTPPALEELSDRQLLDRFARLADQAAFAELVRRHGGMVMTVCKRHLADAHEAEDAFQATWLVLARKASRSWSESIAGWLYEVAHRVACKARGQCARREFKQREAAMAVGKRPASEPVDEGQIDLLESELARLPEKDRAVLALCYLEGKTHVEAARALACPPGSMSKRLARARELLRKRLLRHGLALTAPALLGWLESSSAAAALPAVQQATIHAATLIAAGNSAAGVSAPVAALVEGVLLEMKFEKLKLALYLSLTIAVFTAGAGVFGYRGLAAEKPTPAVSNETPSKPNPQPLAPVAPARTFRSNLPLIVYQLVEGEMPRVLGTTGFPPPVKGAKPAKPINIPAGAVWYVAPLSMGFGVGGGGALLGGPGVMPGGALGVGGGAVGFGGGGLQGGGFGGGANLGFGGGGVVPGGKLGGIRPAPMPKPAVDFSAGLTGDALNKLIAEMKKQNIPGLEVGYLKMGDDDLAKLAGVPGLQRLLLTGTQVSNEGLEKLKDFPALNLLSLQATQITADGLAHLAGAKKLRTLYLGGSKIDNKSMEKLKDAKSLVHLRLYRTAVDKDGLKALSTLPNLTSLELVGNFTDNDIGVLKEYTGLTKLKLLQTAVTDEGLGELKSLTKLKSLTIDGHWDHHGIQVLGGFGGFGGGFGGGGFGGGGILGNPGGGVGKLPRGGPAGGEMKMEWFIPKEIFVPGEAKMVKIAPVAWTAKGLANLEPLTELTELHVSNEKLADADMATIGKLTGLKKLGVFAPSVTDKGIAALKDLKKLEMIDLRGTKAAIAAAVTLRGMPQLKLLKSNLVSWDPKYKTKVADWNKQLPRVKIEPLSSLFGGLMRGGGFAGPGLGGFGGGRGK
jgi:RNA polymerase sigma factor (sigma-70 family)